MCVTVPPAVMLAATIVSTMATMYGQQQQAASQAKYQEAQAAANAQHMAENAKLANASYIEQTKQLQIRNLQEGAAAQQQIMNNDVAAQKARATAKTSAGDSGVSGLSVDALMADFHRQQANYDTTIRTNREWDRLQLDQDMKGAQAQAAGRIASVRPYVRQPVNTPDYLGIAFSGAKDGYAIADKAGWFK